MTGFERSLGEFGELEVSCGLGMEREEGRVEVLNELIKGFLGSSNSSVGQLIVPHFREGYSLSFAHYVECKCDFPFISVIDGCIDKEICADGFHPVHGIGGFPREVSRKCCLEFKGGSGHGGGCWCQGGSSGLWGCRGKSLLLMWLRVT